MKNLLKTDGIVYKSMYLLYQLMILNILWCICSLPVLTIGASTTALYHVAGKIVRKEEVKEFRDFFNSFKTNFRTATIVWILLCTAYSIIFININYFQYKAWFSSFMFLIQLPILIQLLIINIVVFPLLSRFELSTLKAIRLSWILGNKHIFSVMASVAVALVALFAARLYPPLFLLLFSSFTAMMTYLLIFKALEKNHQGVKAI